MAILANARFQCDFGVGEAIGSFVIWILPTIVTLGLASFVAPYYVLSAIINKTWVLLAIVTLGLAIIVYYYMVTKKVLNWTEIVDLAGGQAPAAPAPSAITRA